MKIALVCPYAWDRFGGVQSHVRSLGAVLRARGHEIAIIAPTSGGARSSGSEDVVVVGRAVPVPANGSIAPIAPGLGCFVGTRRALRAFEPDVVHIHEPFVPSTSLYALLGSNAPSVGTFHSAGGSSIFYRAFGPILRGLVGRLAVRTAVSEAALSLVARHLPGDYALTPNGVDVERFSSIGERRENGVLFLGRIEPRKGLDVLIRAMALIRDLDVPLVVAGAGPKEGECRALARDLNVDARWIGAPADEDLPGVFADASIYCNPATGGESFGIVLLEAMAARRPVACSDLPGFRGAAGDAAVYFAAGHERSLADALRSLLDAPSEADALTELGTARAAMFDWRRLAIAVEEVYVRAGSIAK